MKSMLEEKAKLVYSTDKSVPRKDEQLRKDLQSGPRPSHQKVVVRIDRKGRGGKSVTVVDGLQTTQKEKESLLRRLKTRLGTGGTLKDNCLEIQGDHCVAMMAALADMGYRPKRSGG